VSDLYLDDQSLWDLAAEVIGKGGLFELRARGHCMYPSIADGDLVALGPIRAGGPLPGEVVLARTNSGLRLHRVISAGEVLRLRGDADPGPAETVEPGNVCGRVVAVRVPLQTKCLRRLRALAGAFVRKSNNWIRRS
jgi:hypothetical protein